jgi:hypothetical protein
MPFFPKVTLIGESVPEFSGHGDREIFFGAAVNVETLKR